MTIELYQGDYRDIIDNLSRNAAIVTDPPYGINLATNYKARKRGALAECNNFAPIIGDNQSFDPSALLDFATVVLFGANYYADQLPVTGSWHVWDKLDGLTSKHEFGFNDNSDCEFIWSNKYGAARIFHHRWMGAMKGSEHRERRVHPTQKPIALMTQLLRYFVPDKLTIIDPFMGSGTTGIACKCLGYDFIGCEIDPGYFAIAKQRIDIVHS